MYNIKRKNYFISLIVIFILGFCSCFAVLKIINVDFSGEKKSQIASKYSRLEEMESYLKDNYYTGISDSAIETGLYKGLFSSVEDPFTVYYTEDEFKKINEETHGENSGVGIVMQANQDNLIEIIEVIDNAPAQVAGIKSGDILTAVDGKAFDGTQTNEAATKARGEAGTDVEISVLRGIKEMDFTLKRANFINPSISHKELDENIGYIRISTFNDNTSEDFKAAVEEFEQKKVEGMVIDLRNNVGGIVSQGVEIADVLLDEAELAYAENNKKEKEEYKTGDGKTDIPYVLLINENTASTSEILAVGVKDNNGGPLVGTKTYGKGVIQKLEQFKEGDGARITVMQYFSPEGQPINKVGVKPDHEVKLDKNSKKDKQLDKAIELLQ